MPTLDAAACASLMDGVTEIAVRAATAIRRTGPAHVRRKPDGSPVSAADEAAEAAICNGLAQLAPALPIVSEEQTRRITPAAGASYFLVDPLDGTREFIAGRDEFTVNIGVMSDGTPILGVIVAPALGLLWRGIVGLGAERARLAADGAILDLETMHSRKPMPRTPVIAVSRSHLDDRTRAFIARWRDATTIAGGSAMKFCRIAEGAADLYPRLSPTCDWDVAAGHAIVKAAGGTVAAPEGGALRYGTLELIIPGFIATGDPASAATTTGI